MGKIDECVKSKHIVGVRRISIKAILGVAFE